MVKKCENCGKEIQDNRNYETHVQRCMFNRTKTLVCDKCNRKYSYRSSLYLHKRSCNGIGEDEYHEYSTCFIENCNKFSKPVVSKRPRARTSRNQQNIAINLLKPGNNYKYVMSFRTKTCQLINNDENHVITEQQEGMLETDAVNLIEECQDSDVNEIIIEELPELEAEYAESEAVAKCDDDAIVVLEDFGFFNKVEVLNVKHEDVVYDEIVVDFQDC